MHDGGRHGGTQRRRAGQTGDWFMYIPNRGSAFFDVTPTLATARRPCTMGRGPRRIAGRALSTAHCPGPREPWQRSPPTRRTPSHLPADSISPPRYVHPRSHHLSPRSIRAVSPSALLLGARALVLSEPSFRPNEHPCPVRRVHVPHWTFNSIHLCPALYNTSLMYTSHDCILNQPQPMPTFCSPSPKSKHVRTRARAQCTRAVPSFISHSACTSFRLLRISSPNLSFFLRCLLSISLLSHFLHSILLGLSASAAFHFNIERRGASRLSSTSTSCCSSCFGSGSGSSSGPSHPRPHAFAPLYTHVFHPACLSTQPNLYCTALRCSIVSDCQPILAFVSKAEVCSQLQIVPYSTSTS